MRALLLVLGACSAVTSTRPPLKTPIAAHVASADVCPLELSGASVDVKTVEQGVALEFTTYEDVAELRRRVRLLADVEHASANHRLIDDIEGGAEIVFPAELKSQIEGMAMEMEAGACPTPFPTTADDRVVSR